MAKFGAKDAAFFLIDGYSVLGALTSISEEVEAITEDAKPLGAAWPVPTPTGDKRATLNQDGFFDDVTDGINDALSGKQSTARVVNYGVEGNTIGKKCVGVSGSYASKYTRLTQKEQLTKAKAEYSLAGAYEENVVILHEHAAESGDGNTEGAESVDGAASSAFGGSGYLQVSAITLSGRPSVTAKVRHSADDVTYADLITFTAAAARTAERKTVAGTVNRHLASSWAWGGAGGTPAFTFLIGFHRNAS